MAFRQAPAQNQVRHTHPRSVITVIRSYDLGETWDIENAGQLAAGGGQEFAPIYLGDGVVDVGDDQFEGARVRGHDALCSSASTM